MACHLLKAVEGRTDLGLGRFELGYGRDKEKREVDYVDADCFAKPRPPMVVPARTLLSQQL